MSSGWGEAPWAAAPLPPAAPLPAGADVAVVGGGFAGLATALACAERGATVVLLEAAAPGEGASGRTGGLVLEDTSAGPLPGAGDCIAALEKLTDRHGIDCELSLPGCLELVHDTSAPLWRDLERTLSLARRVPGGSLDPGKLVAGLARAAQGAGVTICRDARVSSLEPGGVRVGDGRLEARVTCVALNAYLRELVPVGDEFGVALTLAMLSEPLAPGALQAIGVGRGEVFYTLDLPYLWGRTWRDRLLLGGGVAPAPDGKVEQIDVARGAVAAQLGALEQRVRGLHPVLAGARFRQRWGGPIAFRRKRLPILCRPRPDLIVTGAYAGHGVALSVRIATLIAEAVDHDAPLPDWGSCALHSGTRAGRAADRSRPGPRSRSRRTGSHR